MHTGKLIISLAILVMFVVTYFFGQKKNDNYEKLGERYLAYLSDANPDSTLADYFPDTSLIHVSEDFETLTAFIKTKKADSTIFIPESPLVKATPISSAAINAYYAVLLNDELMLLNLLYVKTSKGWQISDVRTVDDERKWIDEYSLADD